MTKQELDSKLYHYKATIKSIYDADTLTIIQDLGGNIWAHGTKIRLHRINAYEVRGDEKEKGKLGRDYLRKILEGKKIYVNTLKKGKYGRWIAEVWAELDDEIINISDHLVEKGHAIYQDY